MAANITEEQEQAAREAERKRVRESIEQEARKSLGQVLVRLEDARRQAMSELERTQRQLGRSIREAFLEWPPTDVRGRVSPQPPRVVPTWIAAPDDRSSYLHYDGAPPQTCVAAWVQACTVLSVDQPQRWGWRIYLPGEHPRAAEQGDDLPTKGAAKDAAVAALARRGFRAPERFGGPAETAPKVVVPDDDWIDLGYVSGGNAATVRADGKRTDWNWWVYDRTGEEAEHGSAATAPCARAHCLDVLRSRGVQVVVQAKLPSPPEKEPALLQWREADRTTHFGRPSGIDPDAGPPIARLSHFGFVAPDGSRRWLVEIYLGRENPTRIVAFAKSVEEGKQAAEELLLEYLGQSRGPVWGLVRDDAEGIFERLDLDGKPIRYASPREAYAAVPKHVPAGTRYEAVLLGPLPAGSAGAG